MGYTHYFTQKRDLTQVEFDTIGEGVRNVIALSNVKIVREYDEPNKPAEITPELIAFNGAGEGGHETFWLEPHCRHGDGFSFCKTAYKPYDRVVTGALCIVDAVAPGAFEIGSDGDAEDWELGLALAREACPNLVIDNPIKEDA